MEGCVLLGAAGDAMGYVVEFKQVEWIHEQFGGPIRFADPEAWLYPQDGHIVSDDTQMTMFGMEGCARAIEADPVNYRATVIDETRVAYLDWFATQGGRFEPGVGTGLIAYREMHVPRAPGNTCLEALRLGGNGYVQFPINDSKGCGGVMRVAPFAFLPGLDRDDLWRLSAASAALTHGHVFGWASAGALALILRAVVDGATVPEAVRLAVTYMRQGHVCPEMAEVLERSLAFEGRGQISPDEIEALGGGWVGEECLLIAVVAALMDADVATRMDVAANHGGDSDSTCSVAGQIMGAFYGRRALEETAGVKDVFAALDVARPLSYVMDRFGKAIDPA